MTPEDRTTQLVNEWLGYAQGMPITLALARLGNMIVANLEEAVVEERLACAKVASSRVADSHRTPWGIGYSTAANEIAAEILERAKESAPA